MADDIYICGGSTVSHFVQVEGTKLVQVDVVPFLTPSQLEGGHDRNWFTKDHLHEAVILLRPVLESCSEKRRDKDVKKSDKSQSCVFTGETVRVACTLKPQPEYNHCLITNFSSPHPVTTSKASSSKDATHFQERSLQKQKLVAFICPKTSSSLLHLSQLVHAELDKEGTQEISKYFLPNSSS